MSFDLVHYADLAELLRRRLPTDTLRELAAELGLSERRIREIARNYRVRIPPQSRVRSANAGAPAQEART